MSVYLYECRQEHRMNVLVPPLPFPYSFLPPFSFARRLGSLSPCLHLHSLQKMTKHFLAHFPALVHPCSQELGDHTVELRASTIVTEGQDAACRPYPCGRYDSQVKVVTIGSPNDGSMANWGIYPKDKGLVSLKQAADNSHHATLHASLSQDLAS